jgi:hypothetical protein
MTALCELYGWDRVAIVHDSSAWGSDSAKNFEMEMLALNPNANLIHTAFDKLDRTDSACAAAAEAEVLLTGHAVRLAAPGYGALPSLAANTPP